MDNQLIGNRLSNNAYFVQPNYSRSVHRYVFNELYSRSRRIVNIMHNVECLKRDLYLILTFLGVLAFL